MRGLPYPTPVSLPFCSSFLDMVFEDEIVKKGQLFVRGLTPSSNEKTLEVAFSKFGPIEDSKPIYPDT